MNNYKVFLIKSRFFILFIILNFVFVIYAANQTRSPENAIFSSQEMTTAPKIHNKTASLEVANIERRGAHALLTLKNNYNRIVLSFSYSFSPNDGQVTVHHSILPGETLEEEVTIPNTLSKDGGQGQITILGVLLTDNIGDGDAVLVQELRDREIGEKIQIERLNPILQALSAKSEADLPDTLEEVKFRIRKLEDPPEATDSFALRAAMHSTKELALLKIQQLESIYREQGYNAFQKMLIRMKESYKSLSEALSK